MTRIELPDIDCNPADYVRTKLVPVVSQLQSLMSELFIPNSDIDNNGIDMMPAYPRSHFSALDRVVSSDFRKSIVFDPEGQPLNKNGKNGRICFEAVFYNQGNGNESEFRLINGVTKEPIEGSYITVGTREPRQYSATLTFDDKVGCIRTTKQRYILEVRYLKQNCIPICRSASMALVYS